MLKWRQDHDHGYAFSVHFPSATKRRRAYTNRVVFDWVLDPRSGSSPIWIGVTINCVSSCFRSRYRGDYNQYTPMRLCVKTFDHATGIEDSAACLVNEDKSNSLDHKSIS